MPLYVAGQRIRGSEINALPQVYRVATDQVCNNSAVLRNVAGLAFAADAGASYLAECFLAYASNTAADLKLQWSVPAGTTGWWAINGTDAGGGGTPGSYETGVLTTFTFGPALGGDPTDPLLGTPVLFALIGSTAGTVQLQFAQNAANASDTIIKAGSAMRVSRMG